MASLAARLPVAMLGLALLLYVQRTTGSFAIGSLASGSALIGVATGSIVQGRLIDRFGPTKPIIIAAVLLVLVVAGVIAAIEYRAPVPVLVLLSFCSGLTELAVISASRALWSRLLPAGPARHAAYSYEAMTIDVFFILGPGLAGLLASTPWAGIGLCVGTACMVIGGVAFALTSPVRAWSKETASTAAKTKRPGKLLGALTNHGLRTVALAGFGFGVIIGFVEVAVPAAATIAGQRDIGGLLLSLWSLSSVIFGFIYSLRPWPRPIHLRLPVLLASFSVLTLLLALPSTLVGLAAAMLIVGTMIAPQGTGHSIAVEQVAPESMAAEAFGWVITAITIGLGIGQAISGQLVDSVGPPTAFLCAAGGGLVIAGLVWLFRGPIQATMAVATDAAA